MVGSFTLLHLCYQPRKAHKFKSSFNLVLLASSSLLDKSHASHCVGVGFVDCGALWLSFLYVCFTWCNVVVVQFLSGLLIDSSLMNENRFSLLTAFEKNRVYFKCLFRKSWSNLLSQYHINTGGWKQLFCFSVNRGKKITQRICMFHHVYICFSGIFSNLKSYNTMYWSP